MLHSALRSLIVLSVCCAAPAGAGTIDFDDFDHGDIVAAPIAKHPGYTLVVENDARSFDKAIAFDTEASGTADDDLERGSGFAEGNIQDAHLGRILVLQENDSCSATKCSSPDDEGNRPAGKLTFVLDAEQSSFSFDLVDVDDSTSEAGRITFFLLGNGDVDDLVASFSFADFLGLGQGVQYGDNSANHIELGGFGAFDAFEIRMGGSGGVDNLSTEGTPVPEPASVALLGIGLAAVAAGRRRR